MSDMNKAPADAQAAYGQPPQYSTNQVPHTVYSQPGQYGPSAGHPGQYMAVVATQPPPSTWSTNLMDCDGCCFPMFCMYCAICELTDRVDPTIPFAFEFTLCPLRDRVRQMYNIDGSGDSDCCEIWCCSPLVVAQMNRELNVRGAPPTATVITTQPMPQQMSPK